MVSPQVSTAFETGNGITRYESSVGTWLDRDIRDSTGERWYWHIALRTADECTVRLVRPGLLAGFGPAMSTDRGETWTWMFDEYVERRELTLRSRAAVRLCATIPYGPRALRRFADLLAVPSAWQQLVVSEQGNPVPMLTLPAAARRRRRLVVAARHHACEAMGSYVLEGLVRGFAPNLVGGGRGAAATEIVAFPIVDIDGVVAGDQGKGRRPHDHNRDYGPRSRYASVRAIRGAGLFDGTPTVVLDLHTPGLMGPLEERPFLVASDDPGDPTSVKALARAFPHGHDVPEVMLFDEPWNAAETDGERCFAAWARGQRGVLLSTTVEFSNGVIRGQPVTPHTARAFGSKLAGALTSVFE